jgi:hypothetical protein
LPKYSIKVPGRIQAKKWNIMNQGPCFACREDWRQSDRLPIELDEASVLGFSMTLNDSFMAGAREPSGLFDL